MVFEDGIIYSGDIKKLIWCMRKAEKGEPITMGFIGGSITQGSLSSTPEKCYAYLVYKWFQSTFYRSKVRYINAGIGGTTSQFGVARVTKDLLCESPDLVFVEFSVNDENTEFFKETYEGLIRKIVGAENAPAVVILHNVCYDTGISAEEIHLEIGKHYNIPCLSMKPTIYHQIESGFVKVREITPDDLHPNDVGHHLISEVVNHFLKQVYYDMLSAGDYETASEYRLGMPITQNAYEAALLYQNDNCEPSMTGFKPDLSEKKCLTDIFKKGWYANEKDSSIVFMITGSEIAIQYRKSIKQPTPVAVAIIDDDEENPLILDGNFDETWGDCLYLATAMYHGENKEHKVMIRITETHENDQVPFYLVSVIKSACRE